jgi:hypothetical protein
MGVFLYIHPIPKLSYALPLLGKNRKNPKTPPINTKSVKEAWMIFFI